MSVDAPEFDFEDDDGASGFLANLTGEPEKKPAKTAKEAPTEGEEEEPGEEAPEGEEAPAEGSEKPAEGEEDDEGEVELKFGEEARKVPIKEIEQLIAEKATLAEKSQAVTQAEAAAVARTQRAELALKNAVERAKANFEPFSKLNFFVLSKELDSNTFQAVQKEAQAAYEALQFYETELNGLTAKAQADFQASQQKAAVEAMKVIQDSKSPNHIPNFDKATYEGMVDFAAKQGMDRNVVLALTDPAALKLIHMAMQFQKGQVATTAKVAKVVNKPTKVLKPSAASSSTTSSRKTNDALAKLRRTGSVDDAADAFLAGFRSDD